MIYLDNAATTKPSKEALQSFNQVSETLFYNTASIHTGGRESARLLEAARGQILKELGMINHSLIFTSGATESNNIILRGMIERKLKFGKTVLVSELEHPSVVNVIEQYKDQINLKFIKTTQQGVVDLDDLKAKLDDDVILVSIMALNNIIGSVQPIEEIGRILKYYNKVYFHVDATQAVGKVKLNYSDVDALTLSAHKFYGVKGAGALIVKDMNVIDAILLGGGHEKGKRSGTVNLPAIVAMAKALRISNENLEEKNDRLEKLNDLVREHFNTYKKMKIQKKHSPYFINLSFVGAKGEIVVNALSELGLYVSTTSACTSKSNELNETLFAIGNRADVIEGSIRISFSQSTASEDVNALIKGLDTVYNQLGDILHEV
ncbi:cysteine desulfurase family protein [Phocicoccus pinnipedialis]|uniref:Cysteine desulfurase NifS n=1 Tax=Phocicoccus pinnipedialis TaxID=110845 RepID=A0A6V7RBP2_9BACL|nr:cysteine desulfurase family protein [Jeotgalicoccus pinnipedialis]MBP1939514.1 cysteine desulfurase [Jeotgalicoccus pinnipedialis]CAD2075070.1 Putative cysteine desulfurase NifS [Jeotgalicoccus pinnipedialis]